MYVFVDETGNTGENIFDDAQPHFLTAGLISRVNFDVRYKRDIEQIAARVGTTSLHANRLTLPQVEAVATELRRLLRNAGARFAISHIEKQFLLVAKIVDYIFDSGENFAVPWQAYNVRFLRMLLVFKIAHLVDHETAALFWSALMAKRNNEAQSRFVAACKLLLAKVPTLPDARSREIIGDALQWAIDNPEAITVHLSGRITRYTHLPNYVGFINLLDGIELWSNKLDSPVRKIFHDRQSQFERLFQEWHGVISNASDEEIRMFGDEEPMVLRKVFGSELVITNSDESAGIQVVDLILWLINRVIRDSLIGPQAAELLAFALQHSRFHRFSFAGAQDIMRQLDAKFPQLSEYGPEAMAKAKEMQGRWEKNRRQQMANYAQNKLTSSVRPGDG